MLESMITDQYIIYAALCSLGKVIIYVLSSERPISRCFITFNNSPTGTNF